MKTPPSGMSADDFKKIKSQGLDITPVDKKEVLYSIFGKEYKYHGF